MTLAQHLTCHVGLKCTISCHSWSYCRTQVVLSVVVPISRLGEMFSGPLRQESEFLLSSHMLGNLVSAVHTLRNTPISLSNMPPIDAACPSKSKMVCCWTKCNVQLGVSWFQWNAGRSTSCFTSDDASGSTSQAANVQEALEMKATTLLVDEDTCATNFMIRDARMQVNLGHPEPCGLESPEALLQFCFQPHVLLLICHSLN